MASSGPFMGFASKALKRPKLTSYPVQRESGLRIHAASEALSPIRSKFVLLMAVWIVAATREKKTESNKLVRGWATRGTMIVIGS